MTKVKPDSDVKRFEFRSGFGGLKWRGMRTEGDPGAMPPGYLRWILNGRIVDGDIHERPGLIKLNSSSFDSACVLGLFSFNMANPKKLWLLGNGCPGISASAGFYVGHIDTEQDPEFQRSIYYDTITNSISIAKFNGEYYIGSDAVFRKLQLANQPWGIEAIEVSGNSQDVPIATFNTTNGYDANYTIRCMLEFDGKLFIGLDNGNGASKVVTFDGVSIRDDKTAIDAPTCFCLYRIQNGGDAIVMGTNNTNTIYIRAAGSSPGTWTSIGTHASVDMETYKDVLYIADGSTAVWSWNGTSLASANAPASATAVRALEKFNGYLYYSYDTASAVLIGRYDGSTWSDSHKNMTTQFSGTTSIRSIESYRGSLFACGLRSGNGTIWLSPQETTSGTWVEITPNVLSGVVYYLLAA